VTLLNEIDETIMKPIDTNCLGIFLKDLPDHERHGRLKNILEIGKKYFPNLSDTKKYRLQSVDYAGIPETSSVRKYENHEC
jgi:hypothetical protein